MSAVTDISATENTIKGLLSRNYHLVVPEYQRQYSWDEEQWEDFWNDLTSLEDEETHFLGSIVVVEKDTSIDELDRWDIVDGQQRLTTISILLCAIREHYDKLDDKKAGDKISNKYLWEEDPDFNQYQKVKLNSLDNSQYRRLLNGNVPREEESQIKMAASYFANKISELDNQNVDKIRKSVLNNLTIVTIECDNEESAFRLFETLNDRGLELSAVDLMKNYLYKTVSENSSINSEAIKQDWESLIENLRYEVDKPHRFFIHYMLYAKEPNIVGNISQQTLYDKFKQLVDKDIPESDTSIELYISEMANTALLYLDIVNAEVSEFNKSGNAKINQLLERLDMLGYTQERTYLLGVLSYMESSTEAIRAIKLIESFLTRQRFTSGITGSDINELYSELCSDAFEHDNTVGYIRSRLADQAATDDEFVAAISNHQFNRSERTTYLLKRIESQHYRSGESPPSGGAIEHIAPRKSFTAVKYNTWTDYLQVGVEKFNQEKDKLGNLSLLENRLNIKASDKPFEQKKERYRESEFEISKAIVEKSEWSTEKIQERTDYLSGIAANIWDFNV